MTYCSCKAILCQSKNIEAKGLTIMENRKKVTPLKKALIIFLITLCAILALVLAILIGAHALTPVIFNEFYSNADAEYVTPGIYEGLVPQGYAYIEEEDGDVIYLQCGYMADGVSASRIYVTRQLSDSSYDTGYVELYAADGTPYTGHTGGITSFGEFIWLANDGDGDDNCVWVLSLDEVIAKSLLNEEKVTLETSFKPESRSAYCFADGKYLWVGEFYDAEKYPTKDTHKFEVSGGTNSALICAYKLDETSKYGISYEQDGENAVVTPELLLSVTDRVQGFTRTPDGFALSSSYSVTPSHLRFYSDATKNSPDAALSVNGEDVPVYFLDADVLTKDVQAAPMSEEIFVKDGRLYVLFESACQKYIFGNFTHGIHIYSYALD